MLSGWENDWTFVSLTLPVASMPRCLITAMMSGMSNSESREDNSEAAANPGAAATPTKKPATGAGGKAREADIIAALGKTRDSLVAEVAKVIIGQDRVIEQLLFCLLVPWKCQRHKRGQSYD